VTEQGAPGTQGTPGPEKPRYEYRGRRHRDEKEEEKQHEKEEEKTRGEKNMDEKWRHDPINPIGWALVLIWVGLTLLAENTGWGRDLFRWWNWWAVALAGAGAIFVVVALVRLALPEHRRPIIGNLIMGFILLGVGLGDLTHWGFGTLAAFVLIAIGIVIILGGIFRRRR
jgi:hypothetical protein